MKSIKFMLIGLLSALVVLLTAGSVLTVSFGVFQSPVLAILIFAVIGIAAVVAIVLLTSSKLDAIYDVTSAVLDGDYGSLSELPEGDDLAGNVREMATQMKKDKAYIESVINRNPLTGIRNMDAFKNYCNVLKKRMGTDHLMELGIAYFEVENLPELEKNYGKKMANRNLVASSKMVCKVFSHSPVFHEEGNRLVVIMEGEDFAARDKLMDKMRDEMKVTWTSSKPEQRCIMSSGMSTYNFASDSSISDTMARAYNSMAFNKRTLLRDYELVVKSVKK